MTTTDLAAHRQARARAIARAGDIHTALTRGELLQRLDTTLVEALVLGLLLQDVRTFVCVLGHGSTELGEVLRVYEAEGVLRTVPARHETEASHAATALRWVTGEKAAVVTSIGPGAMQALAGSLVPASNGLGVYYLLGDETTEDEGPNMQQIPRPEQGLFTRLFSAAGETYSLHTPGALSTALRRGLATVDHPHRAGPFFLLMPMNTQPAVLPAYNLGELPTGAPPPLGPAGSGYDQAADALLSARRVLIKVGGGGRHAGAQIARLAELVDGVVVHTPIATGVLPYDHPRNMLVGGSKGSISGNAAMDRADLLVAVGTRAVCQSDSSRTGYPAVQRVISINTDPRAAIHYNRTLSMMGEAAATLDLLCDALEAREPKEPTGWLAECGVAKAEWEGFKAERYAAEVLHDEVWGREVLTQPAAIKAITDWARQADATCFFDAGDVQANGFQVVEDDTPGRTFTDTGASYMGFAVSALLATALASEPFYGVALTGDGSFGMNPAVLIDGAAHGATGVIVLLDNRRMAAISSLQLAQHGHDHATWDHVPVDYVQWAGSVQGVLALHGGHSTAELVEALERAHAHPGLSLVHVPVYFGEDPLGGLGAFGRWNVGNWVADTQRLRHDQGL